MLGNYIFNDRGQKSTARVAPLRLVAVVHVDELILTVVVQRDFLLVLQGRPFLPLHVAI